MIQKFENYEGKLNRFYYHMKQIGEGCDYTIGCGEKLDYIEDYNLTLEQAKIRIIEELIEEYGLTLDDNIYEKIVIFETEPIEIDIEKTYKLIKKIKKYNI